MSGLRLQSVLHSQDGFWVVQKGWEPYGPFPTEAAADAWADSNIDDQVFGEPNSFTPELRTPRKELAQ